MIPGTHSAPTVGVRRRLRIALLLVLASSSLPAAGQISLRVNNVIQVQPSASPVCQGLRDVLAGLSGGSFASPYLVRLEPGTYTCGTSTLFLPRWVTLEGAGDGLTRVTGFVDSAVLGVVHMANGSALRSLTVQSLGGSRSLGGIVASVWTLAPPIVTGFKDVHLSAAGSGPNIYSIYALGASLTVTGSRLGHVYLDSAGVTFEYSSLGSITRADSLVKCFYCYSFLGSLLNTNCE